MPPLSRTTHRLLRSVNGKPHASADDHEEHYGTQSESSKENGRGMAEDIMADPISSADERPEPAQASQPSPSKPEARMRKPVVNIHAPQSARKKQRSTTVRVPAQGTFEKGRAKKEIFNSPSSSQSSTGRKAAEENSDDFPFGFEHAGPKRQRTKRSNNIFTKPIAPPLPANSKPKTYGSRTSRGKPAPPSRQPMTQPSKRKSYGASRPAPSPSPPPPPEHSDDESDVDMVPLEVPETKKTEAVKKLFQESKTTKSTLSETGSLPKEPRRTLEKLASYRTPQPSQATASQATPIVSLKPLPSGNSTPRSTLSSADPINLQETVQDLEQYLADLPPEFSDSNCPLCNEPVSQDHYWSFFKGVQHTLRNQQIFCREHKYRTALKEYRAKGYPEIDWGELPGRVDKCKGFLVGVLRGQTESAYRVMHKERIERGEHRVSRRKLLKGEVPVLDGTGYYGARGARALMEIITDLLADEIREVVEMDQVVAAAGFASFVQSVLVPECTVRLVMQDLDVGELVAKGVVEESGELGCLVHEEVEDELVLLSESEEEEEG
ncbi:hypothetical protein CC78DRAFT_536894 [Lojkania enalia]|uniref:Restriction of telomere capping protein 4 n=1 Tax=Lojkania enalia TaxID=147567 RepID=A0A9P4JZ95_9PLEO|nr:hypothetical protein CC78DRAFT_536894 [Didymosphaeria enalia]